MCAYEDQNMLYNIPSFLSMCDQYKIYHVVGLEIRRYGMIVNFKYFIYWLFYQSSKGAITNQSAIAMFFFYYWGYIRCFQLFYLWWNKANDSKI